MSDWQPMATAPIDGTWVLVLCEHIDRSYPGSYDDPPPVTIARVDHYGTGKLFWHSVGELYT